MGVAGSDRWSAVWLVSRYVEGFCACSKWTTGRFQFNATFDQPPAQRYLHKTIIAMNSYFCYLIPDRLLDLGPTSRQKDENSQKDTQREACMHNIT